DAEIFQFRELSGESQQIRRISDAISKSTAASLGCFRGFLRVSAVMRELSMRALNLPNDLANVGKQRIGLLNCEDFHSSRLMIVGDPDELSRRLKLRRLFFDLGFDHCAYRLLETVSRLGFLHLHLVREI